MTVSGNTTMQQLLCGVERVRWARCRSCRRSAAVCRARRGIGHSHPSRGGASDAGHRRIRRRRHRGRHSGDGPGRRRGPTLLVDIGTNGEIVLLADGKLSAASTAAGPAFEGARISCGMRGCTGAIEKVLVDDGRLRIT